LIETKFTSLLICDIANIIATIVVAGNVRRSSEIFISSNPEMLKYKDISVHPYRKNWSWASNNSFKITEELMQAKNAAKLRTIYNRIQKQIHLNGEPGIFNIDNARHYGRICDGRGDHDLHVDGCNPCGEIPLEGCDVIGSGKPFSAGGETCNIFETYPSNYDGTLQEVIEAFGDDLWYAVLYCKAVTMLPPHWASTQSIQDRNRRIGISQTGIQLFIVKHNLSLEQYGDICDTWYKRIKAYDAEISAMLGIPQSIKLTTVKPSGTVSICGGVPSGMHCPIARHYIRRVRYGIERTEYTKLFLAKGYHVEPDVWQKDSTMIVTFPVKLDYHVKTRAELTIEEQFELAALLQDKWSDNQVSCTVTFQGDERNRIASLLEKYKHVLKGISILELACDAYAQLPEEAITEEQYDEMISQVKPLKYSDFNLVATEDVESDNYCDGDSCRR
jgi:adenosylcobalamin-dependent ribonucleoside-triphosphate reductase